jgi:hypothetical protein
MEKRSLSLWEQTKAMSITHGKLYCILLDEKQTGEKGLECQAEGD